MQVTQTSMPHLQLVMDTTESNLNVPHGLHVHVTTVRLLLLLRRSTGMSASIFLPAPVAISFIIVMTAAAASPQGEVGVGPDVGGVGGGGGGIGIGVGVEGACHLQGVGDQHQHHHHAPVRATAPWSPHHVPIPPRHVGPPQSTPAPFLLPLASRPRDAAVPDIRGFSVTLTHSTSTTTLMILRDHGIMVHTENVFQELTET